MIKANELRIGNFILSERHGNKIVRVIPIVIDFMYKYPQHIYNPIPLTEEILLKCGFVYDRDYYNLYLNVKTDLDLPTVLEIVADFEDEHDENIVSDIRFYVNEKWISLGSNNKYLHQLQNLYFALTGEELKIEL